MKKYAVVLTMLFVFVVAASMVGAVDKVSPWLNNRAAASINTQVLIYNAAATQQTCNYTIRKALEPTTMTTGSITIPSKTTKVFDWADKVGFITSGYPNDELPADGKYATMEITDPNDYFLGFTFRYKYDGNNWDFVYSEPTFDDPQ